MADETGSPDPAVATAEPAAEQTSAAQGAGEQAVVSYIGDDGITLKEGWKAAIPEDFRGRKVWDTVHTLPDLLKQLGNKDVLISRQGKGVMVPTDTATQTEKDMFYEALGRPKTPSDYKVEVPKGLEAYYDQPLMTQAKETLHKAGLTQKQVDVVLALDANRLVAGQKEQAEAQETAKREAEDALRAEWGTAYDERLGMANQMIADNLPETKRAALLEAVGNNPVVAELLAKVAMKFMEHPSVAKGTQQHTLTPAEAKGRMEELITERMQDMNLRYTNPAKYERLNREIKQLAEAAAAMQY